MITIKDIAKKAGVSHTTVSRALNDNPAIPERTASAIKQLAKDMGYMRSVAAQGLRGSPTNAVGVMISRLNNPYFGDILQGIEDHIRDKGYVLLTSSSDFDMKKEQQAFQAFLERRVDGLIVSSTNFNADQQSFFKNYELPVVVINNQTGANLYNSISNDDFYGASEVTRYLIGQGYKNLAYLGNAKAGRINKERFGGFRAELEIARLLLNENLVVTATDGDMPAGEAAMRSLLEHGSRPDAVFCFNDLIAIGAMHALKEFKLAVPQQVAVAGFDDIPYSSFTSPSLTTFDQPKRELGWHAAEMLMELVRRTRLEGKVPELKSVILRGKLLVRESTNHKA
ncbi:MAG TPA: LacI family DNA-binding transcriptional regulator [Bellilinea sp.]|nr:LacI family DNA-binding transcriptional regulator [Bellilinea sp.]